MAFASNASAFGMKQQPQQSTGLFGASQQQPQQPSQAAGGLFGSTPTQAQPTTGGLFGSNTQSQPTPGGLFGSTAQSQPTTGLFGSTTQSQPTTGLFGSTPQTQPTTGLFGSTTQSQPTTGLFGSTTQTQPTTGLFGSTPQAQPTTGLFGSTTQAQPTGGLFGSTQPQPTTGGLFGSNTQSQQTTGGLFGSTQSQPTTGLFGSTTQTQPTGGLFGSTQPQQNQSTNPLFGGSLFSTGQQQQPQQQQPQQTSLFGSTTTSNPLQPQATLPANAFGASTTTNTGPQGAFGGSTLFGIKQPQQQQQQQQPIFGSANQNLTQQNPFGASAPPGPPPFTKSTKFNDLPDNLKSILETMDSHIQGRIQISKDLHQRKLGDEPTKGQEAIRNIQKDLINTSATIRNDLNVTQDIKAKVDQAVEDTIVATRIIDGFRNPQSGNTYLKDHAGFPLEYFTRITEQMKQRLEWYKSTIEQIERKLASATSTTQTPQSISATLQAQHATFITLASKTAAVDAELQKIKALYTQLWRAKTGSVRDPFGNVVDKNGDFGLSQLNVR